MTDENSVVVRRVLCGVALVMVLAGACSPAPVASESAPKESAVDAFNRRGAAASISPGAGTPMPPTTVTTPAAVEVAEAAMPAGATASIGATSAPASQTTTKPQTPASALPAPAAVLRPGSLPDTPGKATVQRVCSSCHALGMVTAKGRTEDGWSEVIGQMIENGMEASDDDLQTIHAYLTREFPPK